MQYMGENNPAPKTNEHVLLRPGPIPLPLRGGTVETLLLARCPRNIVVVVPLHPPLLLLWAGLRSVQKQSSIARPSTSRAPVAAPALARHAGGVEVLRSDVRVHGLLPKLLSSPQERRVWYAVEEGSHVCFVGAQTVGGVAGDADLVLAAELEARGLLRDLSEEVEAFVVRARLVLDHGYEVVDLRREERHRGGEHGVELAEVTVGAGEVHREAVERVCVLGETGKAECRVDRGVGTGRVVHDVLLSTRHGVRCEWGLRCAGWMGESHPALSPPHRKAPGVGPAGRWG